MADSKALDIDRQIDILQNAFRTQQRIRDRELDAHNKAVNAGKRKSDEYHMELLASAAVLDLIYMEIGNLRSGN
jgi:hypothetical protein